MFGTGRKRPWVEPTPSKQFSDGKNIWAEGPVKGKFVDPEETGPTQYEEQLEAVADTATNAEVIYRNSKREDELDVFQDQVVTAEKKEWAKKVYSKDKKQPRQERERHNEVKGGEKIGAMLADNDNTEDTTKEEQRILRSL